MPEAIQRRGERCQEDMQMIFNDICNDICKDICNETESITERQVETCRVYLSFGSFEAARPDVCHQPKTFSRQRYLLLAGNVALRSDAEQMLSLAAFLRSATLLKSTSQQTFGLSGMS